MWMYLSALMTCLVMYRRNTFHLWFFTLFRLTYPVCVCDLGIGPADCRQRAASVDGRRCLALGLQVVNRYFQNSCYYQYQLSEYFHKALHSGQDGGPLGRHYKMKKIAFLFSPKLDGMLWKRPAGDIERCQHMIFTLLENNPCAHIMPSVRWSRVIWLPDPRSYLIEVLRVPWRPLFLGFAHISHMALFPLICCSDFVLGSSKGKTPLARVHAFDDWVSSSHCLFLLMLYPDGKTNEKSIWFG